MSNPEFVIQYKTISPVSFKNAAGMKAYLSKESELWSDFLGVVEADKRFDHVPVNNTNLAKVALVTSFERMLAALADATGFNQLMQDYRLQVMPPPPASSLEGQLILGLKLNGRLEMALAVYAWFLTQNWRVQLRSNHPLSQLNEIGNQLGWAAYTSEALPYNNVSAQKLAGARRSVEAQQESLAKEIEKFQDATAKEEADWAKRVEAWDIRAKNDEDNLLDRALDREDAQNKLLEGLRRQGEESALSSKRRIEAIKRLGEIHQNSRKKEFERLKDLFHVQLRLRAPVRLWEARAKSHTSNAKSALKAFAFFTALVVLAGSLIPYFFGDYIAASFFTSVCSISDPDECSREFSAKGPLTVAGLLIIMSLVMWAVRLQYRVYLSERHLGLDASEKQAFAETFLAMREGNDVGAGNEAIVLASLFRPTQDGIIKDDETSFDLSAASILAKQLGRQ